MVRLTETLEALAIYDRGEFLEGKRSLWADDRAIHLFALATEARSQAALLAFGAGRFAQSEALTERGAARRAGPGIGVAVEDADRRGTG